jgi:hypothetical protein
MDVQNPVSQGLRIATMSILDALRGISGYSGGESATLASEQKRFTLSKNFDFACMAGKPGRTSANKHRRGPFDCAP